MHRWPTIGCAVALLALGGCDPGNNSASDHVGDDDPSPSAPPLAAYLGSAATVDSPRYSGTALLASSAAYRATAGTLQLSQGSLAVGRLTLQRMPQATHTEVSR